MLRKSRISSSALLQLRLPSLQHRLQAIQLSSNRALWLRKRKRRRRGRDRRRLRSKSIKLALLLAQLPDAQD
jgi:hypothetical protein